MPALIDLTGKKFGRLTVLERNGSNKHGKSVWKCICNCGKETHVVSQSLLLRHTQSCGCLQKDIASDRGTERLGPLNTNWRGGQTRTAKGYIKVHDPTHLNAHCNGYVLEHVKVMSGSLGRPLLTNENVHHINGVKDDNRLENLELWVSSHPSGQRVEDLVAWAEEILSLYKTN